MYLRVTTAMFAMTMLGACGGGSTGSSSFQSLSNQGLALVNKYQAEEFTQLQNLPSGTFNYNGVAAYSTLPLSSTTDGGEILDTAVAVSSIELNANFSTNTLTGQLSNFVDIDNITASGSVPLNGTITGTSFSATGSAVLNRDLDNANIFTSVNMDGVFGGNQAESALGLMSATYGDISGSGIFLAER